MILSLYLLGIVSFLRSELKVKSFHQFLFHLKMPVKSLTSTDPELVHSYLRYTVTGIIIGFLIVFLLIIYYIFCNKKLIKTNTDIFLQNFRTYYTKLIWISFILVMLISITLSSVILKVPQYIKASIQKPSKFYEEHYV